MIVFRNFFGARNTPLGGDPYLARVNPVRSAGRRNLGKNVFRMLTLDRPGLSISDANGLARKESGYELHSSKLLWTLTTFNRDGNT